MTDVNIDRFSGEPKEKPVIAWCAFCEQEIRDTHEHYNLYGERIHLDCGEAYAIYLFNKEAKIMRGIEE